MVNYQMQKARLTWGSSTQYTIWRIFGFNPFTYRLTHKTRQLLFVQYIYKIGTPMHFKNTSSSNNYVNLFKDTYL